MSSNTPPSQVNYWAISIFSSRTFWLNVLALIVGLLSATEIVTIIPAKYMPMYSAFMAVGNILLRLVTQRPAVFIAPGETKIVEVSKISPPAPPTITD